ncbi:MAG TPA: hypothetical protein VHF26_16670 [Trebonia sp.]|nr:hypothetical protein [Trebonia sp.]
MPARPCSSSSSGGLLDDTTAVGPGIHRRASPLSPTADAARHFLDRLVPVCAQLLEAAAAGEIRPGLDPCGLLRGVGSLCAAAAGDPRYNPRHPVELLVAGLGI